jgi:hypothetical protein
MFTYGVGIIQFQLFVGFASFVIGEFCDQLLVQFASTIGRCHNWLLMQPMRSINVPWKLQNHLELYH